MSKKLRKYRKFPYYGRQITIYMSKECNFKIVRLAKHFNMAKSEIMELALLLFLAKLEYYDDQGFPFRSRAQDWRKNPGYFSFYMLESTPIRVKYWANRKGVTKRSIYECAILDFEDLLKEKRNLLESKQKLMYFIRRRVNVQFK